MLVFREILRTYLMDDPLCCKSKKTKSTFSFINGKKSAIIVLQPFFKLHFHINYFPGNLSLHNCPEHLRPLLEVLAVVGILDQFASMVSLTFCVSAIDFAKLCMHLISRH